MTEQQSETPQAPPVTPEIVRRLWQSFFYQSIAFTVALVVAVNFVDFGGQRPEWGTISMIGAAALIAPSLLLLPRFRELARGASAARRADAAFLTQLRQSMMLGMIVGDLPALGGFLHYVFTGDVALMIVFCLASNAIVYLYRPPF